MDDKRNYLTNFFIQKGLAPHQAAGIVGNLEGESGLDPTALGDNKTSGGLAQWHNERLTGLNKFAFNNNADANSIDTQAEYLWHELNTSHTKALDAVSKSKDVAQATMAFTDHFEKPKVKNYEHRIGLAEKALNILVPNAEAASSSAEPIYADTYEEAIAAKKANPNAEIYIKEDASPKNLSTNEFFDKVINKPKETTPVEAFAQGAANWGSGQFADELVGGGIAAFDTLMGNNKHLSFNEKYNLARDTVRDRGDKAWNEHPEAYGTGATVGAVATPLNKLGAGLSLPKAGAAFGGLYGAGSANELSDVPLDAAVGAAMGGTIGKGLQVGGKVIGSGIDGAKSAIDKVINGSAASNTKNQEIADLSSKLGITINRENTSRLGGLAAEHTDGLPGSPINKGRINQLGQVKNKATEIADSFKPEMSSSVAYSKVDEAIAQLDPAAASAKLSTLKSTAQSLLPRQGSIEGITLPSSSKTLLKRISTLQDENSIGNLLDIRKTINNDIGDILKTKSKDTADSKGLSVLFKLKQSIDNDIENWAGSVGDEIANPVKAEVAKSLQFANANHIQELKHKAISNAIDDAMIDGSFSYKAFRKSTDKLTNNGLFKNTNELEDFQGLAKLTKILRQPLAHDDADIFKVLGVSYVTGEPLTSLGGSYGLSWLMSRPAFRTSVGKLGKATTPAAEDAAMKSIVATASMITPKNRTAELQALGKKAFSDTAENIRLNEAVKEIPRKTPGEVAPDRISLRPNSNPVTPDKALVPIGQKENIDMSQLNGFDKLRIRKGLKTKAQSEAEKYDAYQQSKIVPEEVAPIAQQIVAPTSSTAGGKKSVADILAERKNKMSLLDQPKTSIEYTPEEMAKHAAQDAKRAAAHQLANERLAAQAENGTVSANNIIEAPKTNNTLFKYDAETQAKIDAKAKADLDAYNQQQQMIANKEVKVTKKAKEILGDKKVPEFAQTLANDALKQSKVTAATELKNYQIATYGKGYLNKVKKEFDQHGAVSGPTLFGKNWSKLDNESMNNHLKNMAYLKTLPKEEAWSEYEDFANLLLKAGKPPKIVNTIEDI